MQNNVRVFRTLSHTLNRKYLRILISAQRGSHNGIDSSQERTGLNEAEFGSSKGGKIQDDFSTFRKSQSIDLEIPRTFYIDDDDRKKLFFYKKNEMSHFSGERIVEVIDILKRLDWNDTNENDLSLLLWYHSFLSAWLEDASIRKISEVGIGRIGAEIGLRERVKESKILIHELLVKADNNIFMKISDGELFEGEETCESLLRRLVACVDRKREYDRILADLSLFLRENLGNPYRFESAVFTIWMNHISFLRTIDSVDKSSDSVSKGKFEIWNNSIFNLSLAHFTFCNSEKVIEDVSCVLKSVLLEGVSTNESEPLMTTLIAINCIVEYSSCRMKNCVYSSAFLSLAQWLVTHLDLCTRPLSKNVAQLSVYREVLFFFLGQRVVSCEWTTNLEVSLNLGLFFALNAFHRFQTKMQDTDDFLERQSEVARILSNHFSKESIHEFLRVLSAPSLRIADVSERRLALFIVSEFDWTLSFFAHNEKCEVHSKDFMRCHVLMLSNFIKFLLPIFDEKRNIDDSCCVLTESEETSAFRTFFSKYCYFLSLDERVDILKQLLELCFATMAKANSIEEEKREFLSSLVLIQLLIKFGIDTNVRHQAILTFSPALVHQQSSGYKMNLLIIFYALLENELLMNRHYSPKISEHLLPIALHPSIYLLDRLDTNSRLFVLGELMKNLCLYSCLESILRILVEKCNPSRWKEAFDIVERLPKSVQGSINIFPVETIEGALPPDPTLPLSPSEQLKLKEELNLYLKKRKPKSAIRIFYSYERGRRYLSDEMIELFIKACLPRGPLVFAEHMMRYVNSRFQGKILSLCVVSCTAYTYKSKFKHLQKDKNSNATNSDIFAQEIFFLRQKCRKVALQALQLIPELSMLHNKNKNPIPLANELIVDSREVENLIRHVKVISDNNIQLVRQLFDESGLFALHFFQERWEKCQRTIQLSLFSDAPLTAIKAYLEFRGEFPFLPIEANSLLDLLKAVPKCFSSYLDEAAEQSSANDRKSDDERSGDEPSGQNLDDLKRDTLALFEDLVLFLSQNPRKEDTDYSSQTQNPSLFLKQNKLACVQEALNYVFGYPSPLSNDSSKLAVYITEILPSVFQMLLEAAVEQGKLAVCEISKMCLGVLQDIYPLCHFKSSFLLKKNFAQSLQMIKAFSQFAADSDEQIWLETLEKMSSGCIGAIDRSVSALSSDFVFSKKEFVRENIKDSFFSSKSASSCLNFRLVNFAFQNGVYCVSSSVSKTAEVHTQASSIYAFSCCVSLMYSSLKSSAEYMSTLRFLEATRHFIRTISEYKGEKCALSIAIDIGRKDRDSLLQILSETDAEITCMLEEFVDNIWIPFWDKKAHTFDKKKMKSLLYDFFTVSIQLLFSPLHQPIANKLAILFTDVRSSLFTELDDESSEIFLLDACITLCSCEEEIDKCMTSFISNHRDQLIFAISGNSSDEDGNNDPYVELVQLAGLSICRRFDVLSGEKWMAIIDIEYNILLGMLASFVSISCSQRAQHFLSIPFLGKLEARVSFLDFLCDQPFVLRNCFSLYNSESDTFIHKADDSLEFSANLFLVICEYFVNHYRDSVQEYLLRFLQSVQFLYPDSKDVTLLLIQKFPLDRSIENDAVFKTLTDRAFAWSSGYTSSTHILKEEEIQNVRAFCRLSIDPYSPEYLKSGALAASERSMLYEENKSLTLEATESFSFTPAVFLKWNFVLAASNPSKSMTTHFSLSDSFKVFVHNALSQTEKKCRRFSDKEECTPDLFIPTCTLRQTRKGYDSTWRSSFFTPLIMIQNLSFSSDSQFIYNILLKIVFSASSSSLSDALKSFARLQNLDRSLFQTVWWVLLDKIFGLLNLSSNLSSNWSNVADQHIWSLLSFLNCLEYCQETLKVKHLASLTNEVRVFVLFVIAGKSYAREMINSVDIFETQSVEDVVERIFVSVRKICESLDAEKKKLPGYLSSLDKPTGRGIIQEEVTLLFQDVANNGKEEGRGDYLNFSLYPPFFVEYVRYKANEKSAVDEIRLFNPLMIRWVFQQLKDKSTTFQHNENSISTSSTDAPILQIANATQEFCLVGHVTLRNQAIKKLANKRQRNIWSEPDRKRGGGYRSAFLIDFFLNSLSALIHTDRNAPGLVSAIITVSHQLLPDVFPSSKRRMGLFKDYIPLNWKDFFSVLVFRINLLRTDAPFAEHLSGSGSKREFMGVLRMISNAVDLEAKYKKYGDPSNAGIQRFLSLEKKREIVSFFLKACALSLHFKTALGWTLERQQTFVKACNSFVDLTIILEEGGESKTAVNYLGNDAKRQIDRLLGHVSRKFSTSHGQKKSLYSLPDLRRLVQRCCLAVLCSSDSYNLDVNDTTQSSILQTICYCSVHDSLLTTNDELVRYDLEKLTEKTLTSLNKTPSNLLYREASLMLCNYLPFAKSQLIIDKVCTDYPEIFFSSIGLSSAILYLYKWRNNFKQNSVLFFRVVNEMNRLCGVELKVLMCMVSPSAAVQKQILSSFEEMLFAYVLDQPWRKIEHWIGFLRSAAVLHFLEDEEADETFMTKRILKYLMNLKDESPEEKGQVYLTERRVLWTRIVHFYQFYYEDFVRSGHKDNKTFAEFLIFMLSHEAKFDFTNHFSEVLLKHSLQLSRNVESEGLSVKDLSIDFWILFLKLLMKVRKPAYLKQTAHVLLHVLHEDSILLATEKGSPDTAYLNTNRQKLITLSFELLAWLNDYIDESFSSLEERIALILSLEKLCRGVQANSEQVSSTCNPGLSEQVNGVSCKFQIKDKHTIVLSYAKNLSKYKDLTLEEGIRVASSFEYLDNFFFKGFEPVELYFNRLFILNLYSMQALKTVLFAAVMLNVVVEGELKKVIARSAAVVAPSNIDGILCLFRDSPPDINGTPSEKIKYDERCTKTEKLKKILDSESVNREIIDDFDSKIARGEIHLATDLWLRVPELSLYSQVLLNVEDRYFTHIISFYKCVLSRDNVNKKKLQHFFPLLGTEALGRTIEKIGKLLPASKDGMNDIYTLCMHLVSQFVRAYVEETLGNRTQKLGKHYFLDTHIICANYLLERVHQSVFPMFWNRGSVFDSVLLMISGKEIKEIFSPFRCLFDRIDFSSSVRRFTPLFNWKLILSICYGISPCHPPPKFKAGDFAHFLSVNDIHFLDSIDSTLRALKTKEAAADLQHLLQWRDAVFCEAINYLDPQRITITFCISVSLLVERWPNSSILSGFGVVEVALLSRVLTMLNAKSFYVYTVKAIFFDVKKYEYLGLFPFKQVDVVELFAEQAKVRVEATRESKEGLDGWMSADFYNYIAYFMFSALREEHSVAEKDKLIRVCGCLLELVSISPFTKEAHSSFSECFSEIAAFIMTESIGLKKDYHSDAFVLRLLCKMLKKFASSLENQTTKHILDINHAQKMLDNCVNLCFKILKCTWRKPAAFCSGRLHNPYRYNEKISQLPAILLKIQILIAENDNVDRSFNSSVTLLTKWNNNCLMYLDNYSRSRLISSCMRDCGTDYKDVFYIKTRNLVLEPVTCVGTSEQESTEADDLPPIDISDRKPVPFEEEEKDARWIDFYSHFDTFLYRRLETKSVLSYEDYRSLFEAFQDLIKSCRVSDCRISEFLNCWFLLFINDGHPVSPSLAESILGLLLRQGEDQMASHSEIVYFSQLLTCIPIDSRNWTNRKHGKKNSLSFLTTFIIEKIAFAATCLLVKNTETSFLFRNKEATILSEERVRDFFSLFILWCSAFPLLPKLTNECMADVVKCLSSGDKWNVSCVLKFLSNYYSLYPDKLSPMVFNGCFMFPISLKKISPRFQDNMLLVAQNSMVAPLHRSNFSLATTAVKFPSFLLFVDTISSKIFADKQKLDLTESLLDKEELYYKEMYAAALPQESRDYFNNFSQSVRRNRSAVDPWKLLMRDVNPSKDVSLCFRLYLDELVATEKWREVEIWLRRATGRSEASFIDKEHSYSKTGETDLSILQTSVYVDMFFTLKVIYKLQSITSVKGNLQNDENTEGKEEMESLLSFARKLFLEQLESSKRLL